MQLFRGKGGSFALSLSPAHPSKCSGLVGGASHLFRIFPIRGAGHFVETLIGDKMQDVSSCGWSYRCSRLPRGARNSSIIPAWWKISKLHPLYMRYCSFLLFMQSISDSFQKTGWFVNWVSQHIGPPMHTLTLPWNSVLSTRWPSWNITSTFVSIQKSVFSIKFSVVWWLLLNWIKIARKLT